jgi:hypothetical protein
MDNAQIVGGWAPCNHGRGAWFGMFVENVVQGIARDLLAAAMLRLEAAGYPVVLHVHDEVVCELPVGEGSLEEFKRLVEQAPDWAAGMPMMAKAREGPRFAAVDAPVAHVAGTLDAPPPKDKAKRAAPLLEIEVPASVQPLALADCTLDATDPIARLIAYIVERERVRVRKEAGEPWPWTMNPVLRDGRFCNNKREHDPPSRYICEAIVKPCRNDPDLAAKVFVARCVINWVPALKEIDWLRPFDLDYLCGVLKAREARGEKWHNEAFKAPMPPTIKGMSALEGQFKVVLPPIAARRDYLAPKVGDTLMGFGARWQECEGVGLFLSWQITHDLRDVEPLRSAPDGRYAAGSGPGSQRGLNRVRCRAIDASWTEAEWLRELLVLLSEITPLLTEAGLIFHAQDLQHILCEFDKFERISASGKFPRRYRLSEGIAPAQKPVKTKKPRSKPEPLVERIGPRVARIERLVARLEPAASHTPPKALPPQDEGDDPGAAQRAASGLAEPVNEPIAAPPPPVIEPSQTVAEPPAADSVRAIEPAPEASPAEGSKPEVEIEVKPATPQHSEARTTGAEVTPGAAEPTPGVSQAPPPKPKTHQIDFANTLLPAALAALTTQPRWVSWRWEWRAPKWTKPPLRPGGGFPAYAKNNLSSTWGSCARPYYLVEGAAHYPNLYVLLAGETAKARKGTSAQHIRRILADADPEWAESHVASGISSGEGILHAIRDPVEKMVKGKLESTPEWPTSASCSTSASFRRRSTA